MQSLQQIADAWGKWSASQFHTVCQHTAMTDFKQMPDGLKQYQLDARIQKLEYDGSSVPTDASAIAYNQWYDNGSSVDQSDTFKAAKHTKRSFEWSIETTLEIGSELAITTGVPEVASASEKIETKFTLSSKIAGAVEDDQEWEVNIPVLVPAQKSVYYEMLLYTQTYDITFVANVLLRNCIGIIYKDPVDFNRNGGPKFRNWVLDVREVFHQINDNKVADTSGYLITKDGVEIGVSGVFKGGHGIGQRVRLFEYPLRTARSPVRSDGDLIASYCVFPLADGTG